MSDNIKCKNVTIIYVSGRRVLRYSPRSSVYFINYLKHILITIKYLQMFITLCCNYSKIKIILSYTKADT